MYYIFEDEHGRVGFKIKGQNEIDENDTPISEENYNLFFEQQNKGINLRIKDANAEVFEALFEEYTPEIPPDIIEELEREQAKAQEIEELKEQVEELQDLVNLLLTREEGLSGLSITTKYNK